MRYGFKNAEEVKETSLKYNLHSWSVQGKLNPAVVEKAEGIYYYTADGKKMADMSSQLVNLNVGYGNKDIIDAIKEQAEKLAYISPAYAIDCRSKLAEMVVKAAPKNMGKVFFTLGGADANENAIKIAKLVTGRYKIFSRYRAYHGSSFGAGNLTGEPRRYTLEPGIPGFVKFTDPYLYHAPFPFESEEQATEYYLGQLRDQIIYVCRLCLNTVENEKRQPFPRPDFQSVRIRQTFETASILLQVVIPRRKTACRKRQRQTPVNKHFRLHTFRHHTLHCRQIPATHFQRHDPSERPQSSQHIQRGRIVQIQVWPCNEWPPVFEIADRAHVIGFHRIASVFGDTTHGLHMRTGFQQYLCGPDDFLSGSCKTVCKRQPIVLTQLMPSCTYSFAQINDIDRHRRDFAVKRRHHVFRPVILYRSQCQFQNAIPFLSVISMNGNRHPMSVADLPTNAPVLPSIAAEPDSRQDRAGNCRARPVWPPPYRPGCAACLRS